jgi:uncharacterized protein (TIGR02757 family)
MNPHEMSETLERLYRRLNRREYVHPDPLEFLFRFEDPGDREVVALVASSLAFGRVSQILKSAGEVIRAMGPAPARYLADASTTSLKRRFGGFSYRFVKGAEMTALLLSARTLVEEFGSLNRCFLAGSEPADETVIPALTRFAERFAEGSGYLMPLPRRGSACKRMNLFLRWMVRKDAVDPGGWTGISPAGLVVPLDTHMHRIGRDLGLTKRKSGDMRTALEITAGFRRLCPEDPVRYDFALTRLGIRDDLGDLSMEGWTKNNV